MYYFSDLSDANKNSGRVSVKNIRYIGVRDVDDAEMSVMRQHSIRNYTSNEVVTRGEKTEYHANLCMLSNGFVFVLSLSLVLILLGLLSSDPLDSLKFSDPLESLESIETSNSIDPLVPNWIRVTLLQFNLGDAMASLTLTLPLSRYRLHHSGADHRFGANEVPSTYLLRYRLNRPCRVSQHRYPSS